MGEKAALVELDLAEGLTPPFRGMRPRGPGMQVDGPVQRRLEELLKERAAFAESRLQRPATRVEESLPAFSSHGTMAKLANAKNLLYVALHGPILCHEFPPWNCTGWHTSHGMYRVHPWKRLAKALHIIVEEHVNRVSIGFP